MPANSSPVLFPLSMPSLGPRRYLALRFPFLPTDRVRRLRPYGDGPVDRPLLVAEKIRGALRVAAADAAALRLGLRIGMTLAEARALVPDIVTTEADSEADASLLQRCAAACEIFTPLVALRAGAGLILDVTGCAHLFGGEKELAFAACRRLNRLGLAACFALAGTPEAAWALARERHGSIVAPGEEEALTQALPIMALERDSETILALQRAGFLTLGDLAARAPYTLAARFGEDLVIALRRLLGREDIRITPLRPPPEIIAEKHFSEPLGLMESLLAALERLTRDVARALEKREAGGRHFEASFFRADGAVRRIAVETAEATRDTTLLMRLIRLRIEALADPLDPGFGFDALRLAVLRSETFDSLQPALAGEAAVQNGERAVADLVNRLVARFGRENVRRFVTHDTHDPVRAAGTVPYLAGVVSVPPPEPEPGSPPLRPLTLFEHPQWIEVMAEVPDSPPLRFRWRRVLHEVARAEGPERIAPEWWREASPAPAIRDYYRVEDANGHRFWIFREGLYEDSNARPRWFLHGLFA